ncbi:hypothetical protein AcdelDRAFT_1881 [Acidovorax delafieldii 2AN]|uniref:Uncharacterized protein n=1 Tax=Acidovorax delafieldii 2AN TaxID=573060 RepID=C5T4Q1_ACIDE|nr:hypothetical protein AcdelDRAFT_1881 [Acidovorax delafieldii 2AN]
MLGECDTERTDRTIANAFRNFGDLQFAAPQQSPASAMRQASKYVIGATATAWLKRSKKAERDIATSRASYAMLQEAAGLSCMARSAIASLGSTLTPAFVKHPQLLHGWPFCAARVLRGAR